MSVGPVERTTVSAAPVIGGAMQLWGGGWLDHEILANSVGTRKTQNLGKAGGRVKLRFSEKRREVSKEHAFKKQAHPYAKLETWGRGAGLMPTYSNPPIHSVVRGDPSPLLGAMPPCCILPHPPAPHTFCGLKILKTRGGLSTVFDMLGERETPCR